MPGHSLLCENSVVNLWATRSENTLNGASVMAQCIRALAAQTQGTEFGSQHPYKKQGMVPNLPVIPAIKE